MDAAARKRRARQSARKSAQRSVELPTLALVFLVYGGWLGVTLAYSHWPLWIVALLAAPLITLHSSLQHEILHGHPTRWRRLNRLIGIVPLSLWLPYGALPADPSGPPRRRTPDRSSRRSRIVLLGARAMAAIEFAAAVSRAVANDAGRPDFDWTLLERLAFLATFFEWIGISRNRGACAEYGWSISFGAFPSCSGSPSSAGCQFGFMSSR